MKKKTKGKIIRPTNVLNVFIILFVLMTVVGYVILFLNDNYSFDGKESLDIKNYEMKISIEDIGKDEIQYYQEGERLVIKDENTVIGTIVDSGYDQEKDTYVVSLSVIGTYTSKTGFMLNGNKNLATGDIIILESTNRTVKVLSIDAIK